LECDKCGLIINRQLNASINLYLRMWGFPPSMRVWLELIEPILRRSGATLNGEKTNDILPMNPERELRLMCPKADVRSSMRTSAEPPDEKIANRVKRILGDREKVPA